jgi:excisionase family DNA binding protein
MTSDQRADLEAAFAQIGAGLDQLKAALATERLGAEAQLRTPPVQLLAVAEAAARLGVGRTTVYELLSAGQIRSVKVGRRRLIPATALAEYVNHSAND